MTITAEGLVLAGTVLAPMRRDVGGKPYLAIDGVEECILALLAAAYGRAVGPAVLGNIRRAAREWRRGEACLVQIHLAHGGLPRLANAQKAASRLQLGKTLLAAGVTPRELMKTCGLDPAALDLFKAGYDPDQPRVPAGNPDGGQWTGDDSADGSAGSSPSVLQDQPSSATGTVLADYKVIKEPPKDAKVVIPADGVPIKAGDPPALLIAPPRADFRQVFAAGQAIASLPPLDQTVHIRAALHQGGTYDFQRDPIRQETQPAYANASNYAVGVYLAGAGYPLWAAQKNGRGLCAFQFQ
jgi:hypothetical protein